MTPAEKLAKTKSKKRKPRRLPVQVRNIVWQTRITDLRNELRLSMADVAAALDMSLSGFHAVEHGTDPMLTTATKIAEFFGRPINDIWNKP